MKKAPKKSGRYLLVILSIIFVTNAALAAWRGEPRRLPEAASFPTFPSHLDEGTDTLSWDNGTATWFFSFPAIEGEDSLFNVRFLSPDTCKLLGAWFMLYLGEDSIYTASNFAPLVWSMGPDSFPSQILGGDTLPWAEIDTFAWSDGNIFHPAWCFIDLSGLDIHLDSAQWFHIGFTGVLEQSTDTIAIIADNGVPNSGTPYSAFMWRGDWYTVQYLYGVGYNLFIRALVDLGSAGVWILAPNGGETWLIGATDTIQWSSAGVSGNVKIELNRTYPTGAWQILFANTTNDQIEPWPVSGETTTQARIRIASVSQPTLQDISNGDFTITNPYIVVGDPNGGDVWAENETQTFTWEGAGVNGNIRIELNRDYPSGIWETLFASIPFTNFAQDWVVIGPATNTARARISAIGDTLSDISDGNFFILPPTLRILRPNGGEQWYVASSDTVQWIGLGFEGGIRIELNRNYPEGEWELLMDGTENNGAEAVFVTEPLSDHCRVKVSALEDTLFDISDGDFSIDCSQGYLALVRPLEADVRVLSWEAGTVDSTHTVIKIFCLKNFGSEMITIFQPLEPPSAEFSLVTNCPGLLDLAPGEMSVCQVALTFNPSANGIYYDTLLIQSNAVNQQSGYVRFPLSGEQITSATAQVDEIPREFALHPNRPNPFNPMTRISYDLPKASLVTLRVFDLLGREVRTLARGLQPAGSHTVLFDGSGLASGVYLCRFQAGEFSAIQKMMLLK